METIGIALEQELGSSGEDFNLEFDVILDHWDDAKGLRRTVFKAEVDDTEIGLKLGVFQEVIRDDLRDDIFTEFNNDADAFFVGFIAEIGDAIDDFRAG